MIMQFRSERNANGHCKYLAFDTAKKEYALEPRGWISKDMPTVKARDIRYMVSVLEADGYKRIERM